jgi:hypothetical protein
MTTMVKLTRGACVSLLFMIVVINCSWLGVNGELSKSGFPKDFLFGTASSSYQVTDLLLSSFQEANFTGN